MAANVDFECELVRNLTLEGGFMPPSLRPVGATVQFVQFIIEMTVLGLFVLCFAFFKYAHPNRAKFYRLHSRPLWNVVVVHMGGVVAGVTGSYFLSHELEVGLPCWVQVFACAIVVPLLLAPCLVRLYNFYKSDELTQTLLAPTPAPTPAAVVVDINGQMDSKPPSSSHQQSPGGQLLLLVRMDEESVSQATTSFPARLRQAHAWWYGWMGCCSSRRNENTEEKLLRLRSQTSQSRLRLLLVLALTPYFVTALVFISVQQGIKCYGCNLTLMGKIVVLIESALGASLIALFLYLVHGKQDSFGVLWEIRSSLLWGGVPSVVAYGLEILLGVQGEFSFYMPLEFFFMVFCYFQSAHQCVLAWLESKQAVEAQTLFHMSIVDFEQLVVHPQGPYHFAFCKHLEMEHSLESISFLGAVDMYERGFYDVSARTNTTRVKKILKMYVGDDAVLPCNFSSRVTEKLRGVAGAESTVDLFREAKEELCTMLYRDAFTRFIITKQFQSVFQEQLLQQQQQRDTAVVHGAYESL